MNIVEIIYLLYSGLQGSSVWIELPSYVGANVGAFVGDGAGDWAVHSIFKFDISLHAICRPRDMPTPLLEVYGSS